MGRSLKLTKRSHQSRSHQSLTNGNSMARMLLIILLTFVCFVASNTDEESDHLQHSEKLQNQDSAVISIRHDERSIREASSGEKAQQKKRRRPQRKRNSKNSKFANKKKEKNEQTNKKSGKGQGR